MMQHTEKHQFNLIETSDTFSPAALNENMEKLEAALAAKADAAGHDELEQRVQVLELHKMAVGSYVGGGSSRESTKTINLGFTPAIVITDLPNTSHVKAILCTPDHPCTSIEIVPGGFKVSADATATNNASYDSLNQKGKTYRYLAFS